MKTRKMRMYRNSEGDPHRINGPAYIDPSGTQYWFINGKLHRTDGPAYVDSDDNMLWYINGDLCVDNKSFQIAANLSDEDMTAMILKYGDVK